MKFQAFHVNPGEKLKKKDVNNNLSNFMSVFPTGQLFLTIRYTNLKKNNMCTNPILMLYSPQLLYDM